MGAGIKVNFGKDFPRPSSSKEPANKLDDDRNNEAQKKVDARSRCQDIKCIFCLEICNYSR